jgi:hypothetical protein
LIDLAARHLERLHASRAGLRERRGGQRGSSQKKISSVHTADYTLGLEQDTNHVHRIKVQLGIQRSLAVIGVEKNYGHGCNPIFTPVSSFRNLSPLTSPEGGITPC